MLPPCWGPERTVCLPILLTFRRTPRNGPPISLQASSFARMYTQERFHRRCRHLGRVKRKRSFDGCLPFRELKSSLVTVTTLSGEPSFARTLAVAIQCWSGKRRRSFGAAPRFAEQRRATGPRSGGIFRASPVALVYACYRGSLSWLCGLSAIVPLHGASFR